MKRAFDLIAAIFGLVLLTPVFALVALLIRREDRGPVFYRQTRVGRHGHLFHRRAETHQGPSRGLSGGIRQEPHAWPVPRRVVRSHPRRPVGSPLGDNRRAGLHA